MTEEEWLACDDPAVLFQWVRPTCSKRKEVLYLCGGCREIAHLFFSAASSNAVEVAERFVDGLATGDELGRAAWDAESPTFGYDFESYFWERHLFDPSSRAERLGKLVKLGALDGSVLLGGEWRVNEEVRDRLLLAARLAERCVINFEWRGAHYEDFRRIDWPGRWLIDCVFGNPFRPVTLDPGWQTEPVVGLAQAIYEDRAFDRLPILADALEDAGCDDPDILSHCRGPGPHVRGCWVVDLVLGKS